MSALPQSQRQGHPSGGWVKGASLDTQLSRGHSSSCVTVHSNMAWQLLALSLKKQVLSDMARACHHPHGAVAMTPRLTAAFTQTALGSLIPMSARGWLCAP